MKLILHAALFAASLLLMAQGKAPGDGVDWVPQSGGSVPATAVPSGRDTNGQPLFLCVAEHNGGLHPGKLRDGFSGCNFSFGGRELTARSYTVMVGAARWIRAAGGQVPREALQSGNESDGRPLFACRTQYRGSLQIGKVRPGFGGCNFGYGGSELTGASYEVLVS